MKNFDNKIDKYLKKVSLVDYFITKNINKLIKNKNNFKYLKENIFLLAISNKLGKNSFNILLENKNFYLIKILIKNNFYILKYSNNNEQNLLQSLCAYDYFYQLIIDFIKDQSFDLNLKICILNNNDSNNKNFIDYCIDIIKMNEDIKYYKKLEPIIMILKYIYELDKEEIFLLITKLCRYIINSNLLLKIIKYINPYNFDIYPDENLYTSIDYLILDYKFDILEFLIERINYVYFVNYEDNSIFILLDNLYDNTLVKSTNSIIKIIFLILSKSNIKKIKNIKNENIFFKLLNIFDLDINIIKKYLKYFDIFEQNTMGVNLYQILTKKYNFNIKKILDGRYFIDSQIKYCNNHLIDITQINYNFNIKKFLKETNYGLFNSDPIHNMIYTRIILQHKNLIIPYLKQSDSFFLNDEKNLRYSNNDKDIIGLIKVYFYYFNTWLPHLIIWKNKLNYFIHPQLINWIKNNSSTKRFIYIKLSIMETNKLQGNFRHANLILIDNYKKIVERFEPYGEIYFANGIEINNTLQEEIANKIGYTYHFVQPYPGFQIRSNELDTKNKSYGDPGGYCLAWCFLYLELKLYYENELAPNLKKSINNNKIYELLLIDEVNNENNIIIKLINNYIINNFINDFPELKNDKQQNLYMTFIRFYACNLDTCKNKLLKTYDLNLSTIYHLNLNDENNKKIIVGLNLDLEQINKL